jgi:DNA polymerase-3 subunit delta'
MSTTSLINEQLPWHSACREQLYAYIDNERIPHALIVSGQEGVGKLLLAEQISHLLLCDNPDNHQACALCHACKLIKAGTHPDFIAISPEEEGKSISIDRIRSLEQTLTLKPHYAKYRVVLINPAHKLNRNAANALLKTLEEPGENSLFLLVTEQLESLPATIRSRCQTVHVPTPEENESILWLKERLPNKNVTRLIKISAGSPLNAIALSENEVEKDYELLESLWTGLIAGKIDPVSAVSKTEKINLQSVLEWTTRWVMELIQAQFKISQHEENMTDEENMTESNNALKDLEGGLNLRQLFNLLEQLFQAKRLLGSSVNKQLMLEAIFISWSNAKSN